METEAARGDVEDVEGAEGGEPNECPVTKGKAQLGNLNVNIWKGFFLSVPKLLAPGDTIGL